MRSVNALRIALACASLCAGERVMAQPQPTTIPTVVAEAMFLDFTLMMGRPHYFVGRTPTGWPASIVPANARVVGGGGVGDSARFYIRTAVFDFSAGVNPMETLRTLVTKAGYEKQYAPERRGGFVGSGPPEAGAGYCKGASMVSFGPVDSVKSRRVIGVFMVNGEVAMGNCAPRQASEMMDASGPVIVPTLVAPRGTAAMPGGRSWGGSTGEIHATLHTTLSADSILTHYAKQLVAAGWKAEGTVAANEIIAAQQFSFRDRDEPWKGALIIMVVGERRDVMLRLTKVDAPN